MTEICIWDNITDYDTAVYTVYVVTEHEGNMNMGQYYK